MSLQTQESTLFFFIETSLMFSKVASRELVPFINRSMWREVMCDDGDNLQMKRLPAVNPDIRANPGVN